MISLRNVLVATDFGEESQVALGYGRTLAKAFGAALHVLHVAEDVYLGSLGSEAYVPSVPTLQQTVEATARKQLDELSIDRDGSGPATRRVLRTSDSPARTIVEYARDESIDLIVMGTHGRSAVAQLLMGSVAERVVRTAGCPVLTVRHPEHEFVLPDMSAATKQGVRS